MHALHPPRRGTSVLGVYGGVVDAMVQRRIGAFQGVNIDAEEPGTAPKPEELFP